EDLVRRMLSKDPTLRPGSVAEVAAELGRLLESDSPNRWPSAPQFQTAITVALGGGNHERSREPPPYCFLLLFGGGAEVNQAAGNDSVLAALAVSYGARMERLGEFARIVRLEIRSDGRVAAEQVLALAKKMRAQLANAPMALVAASPTEGSHEQIIDRA